MSFLSTIGSASARAFGLTRLSTIKDSFFNLVTLLLNTSSTNGAQNNTFLDSSTANAGSGWTVTRNGNTTQGTFTPFSQTGWSNNFASGNYITAATSADFALSGDFTLEALVYPTSAYTTYNYVFAVNVNNGLVFYVTGGNLVVRTYNGTDLLSSATIPALNTWTHIAATRSGTTLRIFVNGTQTATTTNSTSFPQSSALVGNDGANAAPWLGYISNVRLVKGQALYTGTFTPSTSALTSTSVGSTGSGAASSITGTVSLLTCQSNYFVDNSTTPKAITVTGTPSVQAFSPFAPTAAYSAASVGGSGYFDGTGDYLTLADNVAFEPGTGDFAITGWVYHTTAAGSLNVYFAHTTNGLSFYRNSSGKLEIAQDGVAALATSTNNVPVNAWSYVEASRSGTSLKLFINGAQEASVTNSTNLAGTGSVGIGATAAGGSTFTGYFSGWRLVKGSAGNTAAYTPPTAPPTTITNTSLLLNYTNAGIYDAAAKNDLETVGNAQVSTTQAKFGTTSMYFDGTGDWLLMPDSPNLQLGTGDFTIEGWVYLTATGVAYGLVSKGTASTGWSVNITSGNKLQFSYTATALTGATSLSSATWYYFAVVRSGSATGNLKVYLNGSVDATSGGAVTDNFNQTNGLYVGADRVAGSALNGYLDEVRITKYARTITTPTAAFPVQ